MPSKIHSFFATRKAKLLSGLSVLSLVALVLGGFALYQNTNNPSDTKTAKAGAIPVSLSPGQSAKFSISYYNNTDSGVRDGLVEIWIGKQLKNIRSITDSFDGSTPASICSNFLVSPSGVWNGKITYRPRSATSSSCGLNTQGPVDLPLSKKGKIEFIADLNPNVLTDVNPNTNVNYVIGDTMDPTINEGVRGKYTTFIPNANNVVLLDEQGIKIADYIQKPLTLADINNGTCTPNPANVGTSLTCTSPINTAAPGTVWVIPSTLKGQIDNSTAQAASTDCTITGTTNQSLVCTVPTTNSATGNQPYKLSTDGTNYATNGSVLMQKPVTLADITGTSCNPAQDITIGNTYTCNYPLAAGNTYSDPTTAITAKTKQAGITTSSPNCALNTAKDTLVCAGITTVGGTQANGVNVTLTQGTNSVDNGLVNLKNPITTVTSANIGGGSCNPQDIYQPGSSICTYFLINGVDFVEPAGGIIAKPTGGDKDGNCDVINNKLVCTVYGQNVPVANNVPVLLNINNTGYQSLPSTPASVNIKPIPLDCATGAGCPVNIPSAFKTFTCTPDATQPTKTVVCGGELKPEFTQPTSTNPLKVMVNNTGSSEVSCVFSTGVLFTCPAANVGTALGLKTVDVRTISTTFTPSSETVDVQDTQISGNPTNAFQSFVCNPDQALVNTTSLDCIGVLKVGFSGPAAGNILYVKVNNTSAGAVQCDFSDAANPKNFTCQTANVGSVVSTSPTDKKVVQATVTTFLNASATYYDTLENVEVLPIALCQIGTSGCTITNLSDAIQSFVCNPDTAKVVSGQVGCTLTLKNGYAKPTGSNKLFVKVNNTGATGVECTFADPAQPLVATCQMAGVGTVVGNAKAIELSVGANNTGTYYTVNTEKVDVTGIPIDDPTVTDILQTIKTFICDDKAQVNGTFTCNGELNPQYTQPSSSNPLKAILVNNGATEATCTFSTSNPLLFSCTVPAGTGTGTGKVVQLKSALNFKDTTETVEVLSNLPAGFILLIPRGDITYTPDKSSPAVYGDEDLVVTVNMSKNIKSCTIKVKKYGSTDPWVSLVMANNNVGSKQCIGTLPKASQTTPKWDTEIRITDVDDQNWGTDPSYFMLYGAISVVDVGGQTIIGEADISKLGSGNVGDAASSFTCGTVTANTPATCTITFSSSYVLIGDLRLGIGINPDTSKAACTVAGQVATCTQVPVGAANSSAIVKAMFGTNGNIVNTGKTITVN